MPYDIMMCREYVVNLLSQQDHLTCVLFGLNMERSYSYHIAQLKSVT